MSASFLRNAAVGLACLWLAASTCAGTISRTYTSLGHVASIDGARTEVYGTIRYEYDAQGNFTTVTNAIGQVYSFANFDTYGNPQNIIYPKGGRR
ncbi:hypothetical protein V2K69_14510 [Pseudomonas alliivorans]|nr:hypothetical protein [Pseudomonas alliivorans]MEE4722264.1 hypothetical protein [Pseudomonas alliivorans]MEE4757938.1 hypothetical protein [Pseudomonas alliivorans]MEE4762833.1 hypothetical protein [Pseudomonas alliivorans]MEE4773443.1 hypothetical protein [Pseudomonas alliivorans]